MRRVAVRGLVLIGLIGALLSGVYLVAKPILPSDKNNQGVAPPPLPKELRYALIIGISGEDDELGSIVFADNDARVMAKTLSENYGFAPANIEVLTNGEATGEAITAALAGLSRLPEEATVVVYYSGHAVPGLSESEEAFQLPEGEEVALVPSDYHLFSGYKEGEGLVLGSEVNRWLAEVRARKLITIWDACYSERFLQGAAVGQGRLGMASSRLDERSSEAPELSLGLFTASLLEGGLYRGAPLPQAFYRAQGTLQDSGQEPLLVGSLLEPWL